MTGNNSHDVTGFDTVLMTLVLLLAIGLGLQTKPGQSCPQTSSHEAHLFEGDRLLRKLSLNEDQEVSLLAGKILVEIKEGRIRVKESDCLHSLCVNMGWVEHPGQTVFCLPNKFSLEIKTQDHFNLDSVVF